MPGIEQYCAKLNIKVTKMPLAVIRFAGHDRSVEILRHGNYTGVILLAHCFSGNEEELGILHDLNLPVVLPHAVAKDAEVTGFATLYYQVREGVEEAVRYLVSVGLNRFATFYYDNKEAGTWEVFSYELEAYLEMLKRNGADPSPDFLRPVDTGDSDGIEKALLEMVREKKLRSVFCYSDFCALAVYQICAKHGIGIPGDLTVMGFCGYPGGQLLAPSLSTLDLQYENIGHMAVECLRHSDDWFGREVPCIPTPHKLAPGGSTVVSRTG